MAGNVELKGATERDVEKLHPFANGKNRNTAGKRSVNSSEFPAITRWIDILLEHGRIGNWLLQKFRRNIRAPGQQQSVRICDRDITFARIADLNLRMLGEKRSKPFFVLLSHPGGKLRHDVNDE